MAFSNQFFSSDISHGVNFDVTRNDYFVKDLSTNEDEFFQVVTKKRRVKSSGISASEKKDLNRKIDAMVVKNEKGRT